MFYITCNGFIIRPATYFELGKEACSFLNSSQETMRYECIIVL